MSMRGSCKRLKSPLFSEPSPIGAPVLSFSRNSSMDVTVGQKECYLLWGTYGWCRLLRSLHPPSQQHSVSRDSFPISDSALSVASTERQDYSTPFSIRSTNFPGNLLSIGVKSRPSIFIDF